LSQGAASEIYAGLANVQRLRGDVEAERAALQNQLLLKPEDAPAQYRLGLLLSLVDINIALTHLQLASQLDPEYAPVFETLRSTFNLAELSPTETGRLVPLGRGLGLVGEWTLAARAFQSAVDSDAGNAEAWAWLGEAKQHLGQDGGADLNQALALNPESVVVRGLRSLYWKRLGNDRQALAEVQAATTLEPDNPAWKSSLGETYARLGDLIAALASYQRATELAPSDATYWRLLATFCAEYAVHVQDVGLPAAQKAVDLSPKDAQALDVLGWSQLSLGQFYTAEQTLLAALKLAPEDALAHLHLAMTYLQTGKLTEAYDQLCRAVELDPNGATGQQASQILKQYFP
jgi:tetratricopeptide (TPR) repeat protein